MSLNADAKEAGIVTRCFYCGMAALWERAHTEPTCEQCAKEISYGVVPGGSLHFVGNGLPGASHADLQYHGRHARAER